MKQCPNCNTNKPNYEFPTCSFCGSSTYCRACILQHRGRCFNCGSVIIHKGKKPIIPPRPREPVTLPAPYEPLILSGTSQVFIASLILITFAVILCIVGFNSLQPSMVTWSIILGQIGSFYSAVNFSIIDYLAHPYTFATSLLPTTSYIPILVLVLLGSGIGLLVRLIGYDELPTNINVIIGIILQGVYLLRFPPLDYYLYPTIETIINLGFLLNFGMFPQYLFTSLSFYPFIQFSLAFTPLATYSILDFALTIVVLYFTGYMGGQVSRNLQDELVNDFSFAELDLIITPTILICFGVLIYVARLLYLWSGLSVLWFCGLGFWGWTGESFAILIYSVVFVFCLIICLCAASSD
ncbi:MAG: hypothetical protein ACETWM_03540 [Candidatus Lokiarchaeia archaeon]